MQEGAKKRGKERHEEVRLQKISSISSSAYSKEWKQRESSGSNSNGKKETEYQPSHLNQKKYREPKSAHHKAVPHHHT